jgi:hypothetical protein
MRTTSRVIQETMRVASILSFTFREAVEDVEYQGEASIILMRSCPSLSKKKKKTPATVSRWIGGGGSLSLSCAAADELDGRDAFLTEMNRQTDSSAVCWLQGT